MRSQIKKSQVKGSLPNKSQYPLSVYYPTWVLLFAIASIGSILLSWLLGNPHITDLFSQLHLIQEQPPQWLTTPQVEKKYYLLAPTLVLFLVVQTITFISPQPQKWSRNIVVTILLILLVRYLLWRSLSTLNLANPIDGTFSILLLLMEVLAITGRILQLIMMFTTKERHQQAELYSKIVAQGKYYPTVDILIPTYNEPEFILKRTIIGCQKIDYPHKKIYLLDDTRRPHIKKLAQDLRCNYITRSDNFYAKAGNLNNALAQTHGELVAIFDADFVPTKNFLQRTVGFFCNSKIGLVQTPQSFYNSDPIAKNLRLEKILTAEEEFFYRHIQPIKDGAGSVLCAGTSFVARRKALEEVDYFVTESISEDYFTGISIAAKGYELVYLNEKLSAGLAAEDIPAYFTQRARWARGTLQAFFIKANPLTITGLTFWQRLGHFEGILNWFNVVSRIFFLLLPILYILLGIEVIKFNLEEIAYFFLPQYLIQIAVFNWLSLKSRSSILLDIYSVILCFPLAATVLKVMLNPFAKEFKVTPKGITTNQYSYNWKLASPLLIIFLLTAVSFAISLFYIFKSPSLNLGLWWSAYNLIITGVALLTLLDIPKTEIYQWFPFKTRVLVKSDNQIYSGVTLQLSETGAEIYFPDNITLPSKILIEIVEAGLTLTGKIVQSKSKDQSNKVRVQFINLNLQQQRKIIEILYCRPGQWQKRQSPGELQSLWIILKVLLRPLKFKKQ